MRRELPGYRRWEGEEACAMEFIEFGNQSGFDWSYFS
jgi:hypothetical protein